MLSGYNTQQVCESGHQITPGIEVYPEKMETFCQKCGDPTLTACPSCETPIRGFPRQVRRDTLESIVTVPSYCHECGQPYPWTKKEIVQTFIEFGNLEEEEKATIEQDVENIAKDGAEAELSAHRIKRIWEKGKAICYEPIMDFASRTAAHILKGP